MTLDNEKVTVPAKRESTNGFIGMLGVGMFVCCGLPILLTGGIAIGAAGIAAGSGLVVAVGIALAVWGWRRRQRADHCDLPNGDRTEADAENHAPQR